MKLLIGMMLTVNCILVTAKASSEFKYGQILFPAKGNINIDQGTIEVWGCIDYFLGKTVLNKEKSFTPPMYFFNIVDKSSNHLSSYAKQKKLDISSMLFSLSIYSAQYQDKDLFLARSSAFMNKNKKTKKLTNDNFSITYPEKFDWKPGAWHYIALCWQRTKDGGFKAKFYIDGKIEKEKTFEPNPYLVTDKINDLLISVGNFHLSRGSVNQFRISRRERTLEEIKGSFAEGLKKDPDTLLYFDANDLRKMKKVRVSFRKADNGEIQPFISGKKSLSNKKGTAVGKLKTVPGKFGKAIKFFD